MINTSFEYLCNNILLTLQSPAEAMLNGNHPTYHEFDPALINRSLVSPVVYH